MPIGRQFYWGMLREAMMSYNDYKQAMLRRFITYRRKHYPLEDELFDPRRWHVFKTEYAYCNLFASGLDRLLPQDRRHRWFRSMGSSQALALSVFGTMMKRDGLSLLNEVPGEHGRSLFPGFVPAGQPEFDYRVTTLNEPRPTQVDLFLPGQRGHVAVECKLWERELSPCSQVASYQCNGDYASQPGRASRQRCVLTEKGIAYWDYIPRLFHWRADLDHRPCPIWKPYQLVRNVLAAAIDPEKGQIWGEPVTVLVYDANNPACTPDGKVGKQFQTVQAALQGPATLKRTTWQAIAGVLLERGGYEDLIAWLDEKHGITP
jgi:hypothetical protein